MTDAPTTWIIELDDETRTILAEQGHDAPASVILQLRPASLRDLRIVEPMLMAAKMGDPDAGFTAAALCIVRLASPPVPLEVAEEVLQQFTPTEMAELILAFKTGERDKSGKVAAAVSQTLNGMTDTLLSALAAGATPSNSGSTA
jgi:hypothetical protein